jgi:uncharacterized OB-fold protein
MKVIVECRDQQLRVSHPCSKLVINEVVSISEYKETSLSCKKCGHKWVPRQEDVRQCPKCKTAKWDVPRPSKAVSNDKAS